MNQESGKIFFERKSFSRHEMHKTALQRSLGKIIIEENMPKPIKVTPVYDTNFPGRTTGGLGGGLF